MHAMLHFCYWHKMASDIHFWIRSCEKCQRRKPAQPAPKAPMRLFLSGEPNERLQMDICGPLVTSDKGNKYILVITDTFSKYTEAYPMENQEAETVARLLVWNWIQKYGEPEQLHTDQGRNFGSELIKQICEVYGIEKTRTTAYYPQGDGQVERYNKTMMNLIYALVEKHSEWDEILKFAVSAYNGTVNEVTSFTPNYLWFGRELRFTVGSIVPDPNEDKAKNYIEYVKKLKHQLQIAYDLTRQSLRKRAIQCKKYYDRNMKLITYKAGSRVMIKDYTPGEKGEGKMCAKFSGPYWVIDKLGDVNYRVMQDELAAPKVDRKSTRLNSSHR